MATATLILDPTLKQFDVSDRLTVRQVAQLGYGHSQTIRARIKDGTLPAVLIGNRFEVLRSDLHLLAKPVAAPQAAAATATSELNKLVEALVDRFPKLNAEQKGELGRLLAPAA